MAIAVRGASSFTNNGTVTNPTHAIPAGTQVGDLLLAHFFSRSGTGVATITPPTGWTVLGARANSGTTLAHVVAYRIADAADVAGQTRTWTLSTAAAVSIYCTAFSGVDTTSPFVQTNPLNNASSVTVTAPGVTIPTGVGVVVMLPSCAAVNVAGITGPTQLGGTWTEHYDVLSGTATASYKRGALYFKAYSTAGATGNVTATLSTAAVNIGHLLWLREASTGGAVQQGAASLVGAAQITAAARRVTTGAVGFSSTSALSGTARALRWADSALSGTSSVSTDGKRVVTGSVGIFGAATREVAGVRVARGSIAVSGGSSLSASGSLVVRGALGIVGTGQLVAVPSVIMRGGALVAGLSVLVAGGGAVRPGTALIAGAASLSASPSAVLAGSAGIVGTSAFTASEARGSEVLRGAVSIFGGSLLVAGGVRGSRGGVSVAGHSSLLAGARRVVPALAIAVGTSVLGVEARAVRLGFVGIAGTSDTAASVLALFVPAPASRLYVVVKEGRGTVFMAESRTGKVAKERRVHAS